MIQQQKFFNLISQQNKQKLIERSASARRQERERRQFIQKPKTAPNQDLLNANNQTQQGYGRNKRLSLAIDECNNIELDVPPMPESYRRRSPMFTIKKIEPIRSPGRPDPEESLCLRR